MKLKNSKTVRIAVALITIVGVAMTGSALAADLSDRTVDLGDNDEVVIDAEFSGDNKTGLDIEVQDSTGTVLNSTTLVANATTDDSSVLLTERLQPAVSNETVTVVSTVNSSYAGIDGDVTQLWVTSSSLDSGPLFGLNGGNSNMVVAGGIALLIGAWILRQQGQV
jgi:hypothetical protein